MATFAEWKQGFIDNITGGHGMDTKTNIDQYSTVPDILKRHSDAIERLEADARISVEVANLLARQMGYYIEFHSVASDNLGNPKLNTVVKLRPIHQLREMAAQQTLGRYQQSFERDPLSAGGRPAKFTEEVIENVAPNALNRIDKALITLDKCATHYARMLSWVSSNKTRWANLGTDEEHPCHKTMRDAIGESWDAASCPCCQEYLQGQPTTCSSLASGRCPLSFGDIPHPRQCCSYLYECIGGARTWKEWEVAAHRVLGYIKAVRDGVLFSRSIL